MISDVDAKTKAHNPNDLTFWGKKMCIIGEELNMGCNSKEEWWINEKLPCIISLYHLL